MGEKSSVKVFHSEHFMRIAFKTASTYPAVSVDDGNIFYRRQHITVSDSVCIKGIGIFFDTVKTLFGIKHS